MTAKTRQMKARKGMQYLLFMEELLCTFLLKKTKFAGAF